MRAALYARVSSAAQRERETIASQLRLLPEYAQRQGWTVGETYVDDGATAKAGHLSKRHGLARLLADAAAGRFDVVVVYDIDRLTRSADLAERGAILGAFQRAGVKIASSSTGQVLDLRSSMGDLFAAIDACRAAEFNRKQGERIAAGKVTAIARGHKPSGPTPYGLHYDRATRAWSVDPITSAIVREVLERVAAGESTERIALDFEVRAIPRPRSSIWTRERVWAIARNTHYLGTWVADRARRLEISVPPVVDAALYARAQAALESHGKRGIRRTHTEVYLLQGLAVCGRCGSPIAIRSRTPQRRGHSSPPAYLCRSRKLASHRIPVRCAAPIQQVAELDERLWRAVSAQLATPVLLERLAEREERRRATPAAAPAEALAAAERALARLARVEAAILSRFRRGLIEEEALDVELETLRAERAAAEQEREQARRAIESSPLAGRRRIDERQLLRDLARAVETATAEERRRIVQLLVPPRSAILQGWGDLELTLYVPIVAAPVTRSALDSDYSTQRGNIIEISLVA